jgi:hypothetical protein
MANKYLLPRMLDLNYFSMYVEFLLGREKAGFHTHSQSNLEAKFYSSLQPMDFIL